LRYLFVGWDVAVYEPIKVAVLRGMAAAWTVARQTKPGHARVL
jgi:hypothetical protein